MGFGTVLRNIGPDVIMSGLESIAAPNPAAHKVATTAPVSDWRMRWPEQKLLAEQLSKLGIGDKLGRDMENLPQVWERAPDDLKRQIAAAMKQHGTSPRFFLLREPPAPSPKSQPLPAWRAPAP